MNVEEVAKGFLFRMRTFMLPLGVVVLTGGARGRPDADVRQGVGDAR